MIKDIFRKLNETLSKGFYNFVGINNHITEMNLLLCLESEEARIDGIWGPSGIGKTTIARVLFNRLSRHFQGKFFIDRASVSKSIECYRGANTGDHNMKFSLQGNFLSEILGKNIKTYHLGALEERLKHWKVLIIFIDDLDDLMVLDALAGQTQWFGSGSRIIMVTKDKHLLEAHGIDRIYKVGFPSEKQALEMFCRSAFKQNSPADGFMELASEVKVMKGRNKENWMDMLPRLRKSPNIDIVETLKFSYDELDSEEDKAIVRHIACFFNGVDINNIKMMLADSELDVNIGLKNLINKSFINVVPSWNNSELHCLVQEMGKEVVRKQSDKLGKREFLMNSKDVCNVLRGCTGTEKILGISLDIDEIEKPLTSLKKIVFSGCANLKEIPDLSMATRLETLNLCDCSNLAEITLSTIQNLNKLKSLDMTRCSSLDTLLEGINLPSLYCLNLNGCSRLRSFPNISVLKLNQTGIEEVPRWIENFFSLELLEMWECNQLKCNSPRIFKLNNLDEVSFSDCEQLTEVRWSEEAEDTNNARTKLSLITFTNYLNSNQEAFIQQSASEFLILPGVVEVPPYFIYRSNGSSLTINLQMY